MWVNRTQGRENMDILKEPLLNIPISYDKKNGFSKSMNSLMLEYEKLVRRYGYIQLADEISVFRSYIREMYRLYNKGMHAKAYQKFTTAIRHLNFKDEKLVTELTEKEIYRARINRENYDFKPKEMMHIPLNLRGRVKTERYSAPGLPCLYLGASPYVCWVELNRPSFDEFQVARLVKNEQETTYVLDLSILPNIYDSEDYTQKISLEEYLSVWPIIAMCSVTVNREEDDFKPEYIFPQFILEYIMTDSEFSQKVIGIKYASMKVGGISAKQYEEDKKTYISYVIPVSSDVDDLEMIDPEIDKIMQIDGTASGKELQLLTDVARNGFVWQSFDAPEPKHIYLYSSTGSKFDYEDSIFDRIEIALDKNRKNNEGKIIFQQAVEDAISTASKEDIDALFK